MLHIFLRYILPLAAITLAIAYQQGVMEEAMQMIEEADSYAYEEDYDDREYYEEDGPESGYEEPDYYSDY
mgnify:CR=1 FL=1|tara:strand:+ start:206 stop:415 length:210 start_codon:yes stop_codon:yes gene_type:complete